MLVMIAAASVALAPVERPAPKASASPTMFVIADTRPVAVCKGEPRMEKAAHERAIYRPNANDRVKRLIEMPAAKACLLGGAR